ncbi:MAG TPA: 5'-nucleotidase C-terminal domain-containing protein [Microbacterium sp.]|uniref:5'-nucleotidase C-terminal domain-containing protein n=1 Tax=Microbacterium sp. TaxID=51671 RepID=UPI002C194F21|nr:5'-nucleotidase C-terminal domain-containing protein [Microbacterium sp.]HWI32041.1 5'-nucleotidase C-terminal domain-containing protein [Microbacterium sp.]
MRPRSYPVRPTSVRRRLAVGAVATVAALGVGAAVAPAAQAADPVLIDLVTVNDFHGRITQQSPSGPAGGLAALAQAVDGIRATNPNTVFAAAGDMIGASTFESFIQDDNPTIDGLNAAGLDVSAAGNHEFDRGWDDLRVRVQDRANWEYIAANVYENGAPALTETYTKTFDGVTIGFVGAVTEELPSLVNPAGIATLEVRDIVTEVNRAADNLRDGDAGNGEADVVVLLVHEGAATTNIASATDPASPFGAIVNGVDDDVDAIVSGHTHLAYNHVIDGRPVISSGQYGEKFSDMKIQVDPDTKEILSMVNTIHDMWTTPVPPATTPAPFPNYAPGDPEVAAIVQAAVDAAGPLGAVPLGTITADINRAKLNPTTENRGAESTLGNFVADAQLWSAQRADAATQIAFMNPGGLRADMVQAPDGVLTYKEAAAVQPFANTLVTLTLTGAQVKDALEQQWQPAGAQRPFLKLGVSKSLNYTFDPAAPSGQRITRITLDGADLDPAATYRVVVNSFLAAGGDNFPAFAAGTGKRDTGKVDLESMVDYMAFIETATPDQAQRSIGVSLTAPQDERGYEVGTPIDVALSSLEFSTSEVVGGTVNLAIGGIPVGSAPIDRTPVATTDLGGQATLNVTVPAGVSGVVPLSVTVPTTGTSFEVPITVFEKADTVTIGLPNKVFAKSKATIQYTVIVLAEGGVVPTGEVTILDGETPIATATLTEKHKGKVKVTLPTLGKGVHKLSAGYGGSDLAQASTSGWVPVIVW